jgi:X-X-X-Leu-X-X-Gly heptad repeat protein
MKQIFKRLTVFLLAMLLLVSLAPVLAAPGGDDAAGGGREEVIYANLSAEGAVESVYAVNLLNVAQAGSVTDYGEYNEVKNLTGLETLDRAADRVTADLPAGRFYYQGLLAQPELPWVVTVSYTLDGVALAPAELAGRSGHVVIRITTDRNPKADPVFFENYMLQASVTLDGDTCRNLTAEGGMPASVGRQRQVAFIVLPNQVGDLCLEADVTDFALGGIQISALPFSLSLLPPDTGTLTEGLSALADGIAELGTGAETLQEGAETLRDGAAALQTGSASFRGGLTALGGRSRALLNGSQDMQVALTTLAEGVRGSAADAGLLAELPTALIQMAAGLDEVSAGLSALKGNFTAALAALDEAVAALPGETIPPEALAALYAAAPGSKSVLDRLTASYQAGLTLRGTYQAVRPIFGAVGGAIDASVGPLGAISAALKATAAQIENTLLKNPDSALGQFVQLADALSALAAGYTSFHEGLTAYAGGVDSLAAAYGQVSGGISGLADGAHALADGAARFHEGVSALGAETEDMPAQAEQSVKDLLALYGGSDFTPVSFVSPRNGNTNAVQFVIKLAGIETPTAPAPPEPAPVSKTIWERFLDLFS